MKVLLPFLKKVGIPKQISVRNDLFERFFEYEFHFTDNSMLSQINEIYIYIIMGFKGVKCFLPILFRPTKSHSAIANICFLVIHCLILFFFPIVPRYIYVSLTEIMVLCKIVLPCFDQPVDLQSGIWSVLLGSENMGTVTPVFAHVTKCQVEMK